MLYLVPTPIGNLEDITYRAVRVLREAALIACEDTRHTRTLLERYDIRTPTVSCHEHNEHARIELILDKLRAGQSVAMVSDAGMPGISDPGALVVRAAVEAGFPVTALPGPCAAVTALAASGLDTDQFMFVGFPPPKEKARRETFAEVAENAATLVFYEAPHRIRQFLDDARAVFGDRRAVVARELSKHFEEFLRGPLSELAAHFEAHEPRGEMVVLIAGKSSADAPPPDEADLVAEIRALMQTQNLGPNAAIKRISQKHGIAKRELYQRWEAEKGETE
jgi:16S rRNA (cytidine1402-2'-O)-methyltransferase